MFAVFQALRYILSKNQNNIQPIYLPNFSQFFPFIVSNHFPFLKTFPRPIHYKNEMLLLNQSLQMSLKYFCAFEEYPAVVFPHPSNYCHSKIQLRKNSLPLIETKETSCFLLVCWGKSLEQFIFQANPITGGREYTLEC